jgi:hypothetical protein
VSEIDEKVNEKALQKQKVIFSGVKFLAARRVENECQK